MGVFRTLSPDFVRQYFPRLYESMRVDPLRGFFSLQNVEIPSSLPFTIGSYPLQVESGTVGSLSLHLPWMHLTTTPIRVVARAVHIVLREPEESAQPAVFAALVGDLQRAKHRRIIEAETDVTPFTRALQKLLPFLLHRVELDLCDIQLSIRFSTNCMIRLSLSSITTHAPTSSHVDLAKTFVLKSFSIQVFSVSSSRVSCEESECATKEKAQNQELLSLNVSSAELMLTLANSQYDFNLNFTRRIPVVAHANLLPSLRNVFARRDFWQTALVYGRPAVNVGSDPGAWFRYVMRAVRGTLGTTPPLRLSVVLRVFRACIEYQRLHVLQLRQRLSVTDESTLHELESELDLEAILIIRAHARKYVLAEDISSFATRSWLSWALFGNQMISDNDEIAADVRRSLFAVDKGDVESATLQHALNWSKARMSFRMTDMRFRLQGFGQDLCFSFNDAHVLAEVGSSFDSFSAIASIADCTIFYGPLLVFGKDLFLNDAPASEADKPEFLSVRANKSIIDQKTLVQARLSALGVIFNLEAMRDFSHHLVDVIPQCTSLHLRKPFDSTDQSHSPRRRYLNISVVVPRCDVLVVSEPPAVVFVPGTRPSGVVLTFSNLEFQSKPEDCSSVLRASTDVAIQSGLLEVVKFSFLKLSPHSEALSLRLIDKFGFVCTFDFAFLTLGLNTSLTISDFRTKVDLSRLTPFLVIMTEVSKLLFHDIPFSFVCRGQHKSDSYRVTCPSGGMLKPQIERHFRISSILIELTRESSHDCQSNWMSINAGHFHIYETLNGLNITIRTISLDETSGGKLHVRSTKRTDHSMVVTVTSDVARPCVMVEAFVDSVDVELPLGFVVASLQMVRTLKDLAMMCSRDDSHKDGIYQIPKSFGINTSVNVRNLSLVLPLPCGVCAMLKGVCVTQQDALLSGTCKTLKFKDLSTRSSHGIHNPCLDDPGAKPEQRSLSFNRGRGFLNIHLSCVHILMLISTIHRIQLAIIDLSTELSSTGFGYGAEFTSACGDYKPTTFSTTRVNIQGSSVSLGLVASTNEHVWFDVQNLVTVISPGSHVFSIRKLTVLTGTKVSVETLSAGMQDRRFVSDEASWNVLLRHVDIDASHHDCSDRERQGPTYKNAHKLVITLLSRVMIFLMPSQVRILVSLLTQLSKSDSLNATSPDSIKHKIADKQPGNLITLNSCFTQWPHVTEFLLECESQPTSIELLSDRRDGLAASTIASIELDPIRLSIKVALEVSSRRESTKVIVWEAKCPSLRIEDRDSKVGPSRRVVVETEDSWLGLLSSLDGSARKAGSMGLSIGGTLRSEHGCATSSYDIRLERARIVLSSSLHARIAHFFKQCVSSDCSEGKQGPETMEVSLETKPCLDQASRKISVLLANSAILLLSKDPNLGDRALEAHSKMIKAAFLLSDSGFLMKGSMLRWKNLHLSLFRGPLARVVQRAHEVVGLYQNSTSLSLGTDQETLASKPFINSECESVLKIKNGVVHIPTLGHDCYRIVVSDAILESSVSVAKSAIAVLSSLDIGATPENGASAECPEFRFVMIRLLAKIKVPVSIDDSVSSSVRNVYVDLGLDTSADVEVLKSATVISGNVQVAADVTDMRGQCIHLLSPTPLFFSMDISGRSSLKCWTKKYARVTMSPLIVKTLTGLVFSLSREELDIRQKIGCVGTTGADVARGDFRFDQRHVNVSLKGIFIYFLVDEPRMQLMRLMVRDVIFNARIPRESGNRGTLNISVLDLALEDSISWRMPWKPEDASAERWSTLVTGRRHPKNFENSTGNAMPSGLQEPFRAIRKWIRRMYRNRTPEASLEIEEPTEDHNSYHNVLPLISCTLHWVSPMEHVAARLKVEGLDFHVDLAVLSSITEWVQSALKEVSEVKAAFSTIGSIERNLNALNVRVDHIVLEPVRVRVAIRSPPRRIRETLLERFVNTTIGAETAEGVELRFPKMVFNGDFFGMEGVFERIEALYVRTVTSKLFARQLLWQFPNFLKSARVIITCFSRRREYGLLNQVETVAFSEDRMKRGRRDVGLLTVLTDKTPHLKGIVGTHWQISPLLQWATQNPDTPNDDQIATWDITQHVT